MAGPEPNIYSSPLEKGRFGLYSSVYSRAPELFWRYKMADEKRKDSVEYPIGVYQAPKIYLAHKNGAFLTAGVGSHILHLCMTHRNMNNEIDKAVSMHLSLEEVEELIRGLKHKLVQCYKAKVERL